MAAQQDERTEQLDFHYESPKAYFAQLRKGTITRAELVSLMQEKLVELDKYTRDTYGHLFPDGKDLRPESTVLSRRYYYEWEHTDVYFSFQDNRVGFAARTSDSDWDNYAYATDFGLPSGFQWLPMPRAINKIFSATPGSIENVYDLQPREQT